jgi:hypothetical protein
MPPQITTTTFFLLILIQLLLYIINHHQTAVLAAKTAKEWRKELDNDEKFGQIQHQEYQELDKTLGKVEVDSPALIYAHFAPSLKYAKPQLDTIATEWRQLLQSAGIRITVWGAQEGQVLVGFSKMFSSHLLNICHMY